MVWSRQQKQTFLVILIASIALVFCATCFHSLFLLLLIPVVLAADILFISFYLNEERSNRYRVGIGVFIAEFMLIPMLIFFAVGAS